MITYVHFQCSAPNTYVSPFQNLYTILFVCFQIFIMIDFYFIHICDVYAMWVYMCTCVDQKRLLEPLELTDTFEAPPVDDETQIQILFESSKCF